MAERSIDAGGPLWLDAPADDDDGLSVDPRFETLDVERCSVVLAVRTVEHDEDGDTVLTKDDPIRLTCRLHSGDCTPNDERASDFLAAHPWFEQQLDPHMDQIRQRAWRTLAQRDRETAARHAIESVTPGVMVAFQELFPADWDLLFEDDDELYWVVDRYCSNLSCECSYVALFLYRLIDGGSNTVRVGEAQVDLARERPQAAFDANEARNLFTVFWHEYESRLRVRRDEARRAVLRHALPTPVPERPAQEEPATSLATRTPRNAPCPCGSGKKFKRCCLGVGATSALR